MYVLHVAPFDPTDYPPLINTVHVCESWGIGSTVLAAVPLRSQGVLGGARVFAASQPLARAALHRHLLRTGVTAIRTRGRPGAVVAHNVYALPAAAAIAAGAHSPLIYHCHDFHETGGGAMRVFDVVERMVGPRAREVWVPVTERATIANQRGFAERLRVVRNCPRLVRELPRRGRLRAWLAANGSRSEGRGQIITRHGRVGAAHCIVETIEALALLPESVELVVVGRGDDDYIARCHETSRRLGLEGRVFFHPFVAHSELFDVLVDGDAASGLYAGADVNVATPAPNKVYENLALGIPVVVTRGNSVADDVTGSGSGLAVDPRSIGQVADAFRALLFDDAVRDRSRASARAAHLGSFHYEGQLRATLLSGMS